MKKDFEIKLKDYELEEAARFLKDAKVKKHVLIGVTKERRILMFTNAGDSLLKTILEDIFKGLVNYGGIDGRKG